MTCLRATPNLHENLVRKTAETVPVPTLTDLIGRRWQFLKGGRRESKPILRIAGRQELT
jgi:hypothetical protein